MRFGHKKAPLDAKATNFTQEHLKAMPQAIKLAHSIALAGYLLFVWVDWMVYPAIFIRLTKLRSAIIAMHFLGVVWPAVYQRETYRSGVQTSVLLCLELYAIIFSTQDPNTQYFNVAPLVFLCTAVFIPTTVAWAVFTYTGMTVAYLSAHLAIYRGTHLDVWSLHAGLLAIGGSVSLLTVFSRNQAYLREIGLSFDLGQKAQQLEQANMDLNRSSDALRQLDRVKSDLFANVNHELRTPLALVMAHLQTLEEKLPSNLTSSLGAPIYLARQNALRLLALVNDILDLTRLDMRKFRLKVSLFSLWEMAESLVLDVGELAIRRNVKVVMVQAESETVAEQSQCLADRGQLERVLINLLTNAVKFSPEGGEVTVEVRASEREVALLVRDTGQGIDPALLPAIFERGVQLDAKPLAATGALADGLGIGLSLVRMIVEAHQGRVDATSQLGLGSTFTVVIPKNPDFTGEVLDRRGSIREGKLPAPDVVIEQTPAAQGQSTIEAAGVGSVSGERRALMATSGWEQMYRKDLRLMELRRLTAPEEAVAATSGQASGLVLIVDDSPELVAVLQQILSGYNLLTAEGGEEALALARQHRPDLIVADVMMPGGNGLDLLAAVRQDQALARTPVVMLTASGSADYQLKAGELGADGYLAKPFDAKLVRATVAHLMAKERAHAQEVLATRREGIQLLVRGMAHNINNALQYISGSTTLSLQQAEDLAPQLTEPQARVLLEESRQAYASGQEGMRRIREGIMVLQKLADDSVVDEMDLEPVRAIVERAVLTVGGQEALRVEIASEQSVWVLRGQVEDVIINLIKNAQEAAEGGPWSIQLSVEEDAQRAGVRVVVADQGPGMDAKVLERAFEPRFTTKAKGSGLGLAVSRLMLRTMGGDLTVDSAPGQGARFTIWLPAGQPDRPPSTGGL